MFRYAPDQDAAVAQDVCLTAGALELATVSVYINGTFAWCPPLPLHAHSGGQTSMSFIPESCRRDEHQ